MALSFYKTNTEKRRKRQMKNGTNRFATNKGGMIQAPKSVPNQPKATVVKGSDLRNGKGKK
jgi:hypothetical protein